MFLEDKNGLKDLVVKRLEIKEKLQSYKDVVLSKQKEIEKLNGEIQKIAQDNTSLHVEFKEINDKINAMVLMDVWNQLSDTQMPKEIILKDGKPFCEITDLVEDVKKQVSESKTIWEEALKKNDL